MVAVEAMVVAIDKQYVKELKEDYKGYKKQTIKTMVTHLRTWYVINTKEKLAIKSHFLAPCSKNPEAHVTKFARQLDRRQVECEDHGVTITNDNKVDHFAAHIYACGLYEAKFMDDLGETADKSWGATHPHLTRQFNNERCKLEHKKSHKHFESSAVLREAPHPHVLDIPQGGATSTTTDCSFTSAMEYAVALEEKAITQAERIIKLEAIVDGQTILTPLPIIWQLQWL